MRTFQHLSTELQRTAACCPDTSPSFSCMWAVWLRPITICEWAKAGG